MTLVVAPKSVVPVWPAPGRAILVVHADQSAHQPAASRTAPAAIVAALRANTIVVLNYEACIREPLKSLLLQTQWDLIVADEAHRLKAPGGVTSKLFARLGAQCDRRLGLTGTPLPQSHLDAYALMRFIQPSVFGTSYVTFRNRYTRPASSSEDYRNPAILWFTDRGADPKRYVPDRMEMFEQALAPWMFRVEARDVLDLPSAIDEQRHAELEPKARRIYRELETDLISDLETGVVTAANALVRVLRLQQVVGGTVRTEDGVDVEVSRAKRGLFHEFLTDVPAGEPVVVFARFHTELDAARAVAQEHERPIFELSGRASELPEWREAPNGVLAVQIQAGGVGIDLTHARHAVWWSLPWSLAQYDQARARLVRPGQGRHVVFTHLVVADTIDGAMAEALASRRTVIEAVLERIAKERP